MMPVSTADADGPTPDTPGPADRPPDEGVPDERGPDERERDEWARYEVEREARRRRRDAVARPVVGAFAAVALCFLAYDSLGALGDARGAGEPWVWNAVIAGACLVGVAVLAVLGWRRLR